MSGDLLRVIILSGFAGLTTGIGGAIAFFAKRDNKTFLSIAMGFSGGVMIYISFVELLNHSVSGFNSVQKPGSVLAGFCFFGGMLISFLFDKMLPFDENPHELHVEDDFDKMAHDEKLKKSSILIALVIALHNFPEGLAVAGASMDSWYMGWSMAIAIAIHNIPEGFAVALPIYYLTNSKAKAFGYSALTGLAEPVGAICGYFLFKPFLSPELLSTLFAMVAGVMVYITFDELLPVAQKYGKHHNVVYGVVSGMLFIFLMLSLFGHAH